MTHEYELYCWDRPDLIGHITAYADNEHFWIEDYTVGEACERFFGRRTGIVNDTERIERFDGPSSKKMPNIRWWVSELALPLPASGLVTSIETSAGRHPPAIPALKVTGLSGSSSVMAPKMRFPVGGLPAIGSARPTAQVRFALGLS